MHDEYSHEVANTSAQGAGQNSFRPNDSQFLVYRDENGKVLVYRDENGKARIDVRFDGETVWLTQSQLAELFDTTQQNISLHIKNILEEGELVKEATHKDYLLVRREGARQVQRTLTYYE